MAFGTGFTRLHGPAGEPGGGYSLIVPSGLQAARLLRCMSRIASARMLVAGYVPGSCTKWFSAVHIGSGFSQSISYRRRRSRSDS